MQFVFLLLFIAGDIFINATAEYESLNTHSQQLHTITMLFLGQIILQFCIASLLSLSLFNTFPFQVGVWYHFKTILKWFLIFQLIYLILSCTAGGMRLSHITSGSWFYSTVSFLHVLGEKELVTCISSIFSFIHSFIFTDSIYSFFARSCSMLLRCKYSYCSYPCG